MDKYKIIVRGDIRMPWPPSDIDLQIMDLYYESPVFTANKHTNIFDILDFAYDQYHMDFEGIRVINSVELVSVS